MTYDQFDLLSRIRPVAGEHHLVGVMENFPRGGYGHFLNSVSPVTNEYGTTSLRAFQIWKRQPLGLVRISKVAAQEKMFSTDLDPFHNLGRLSTGPNYVGSRSAPQSHTMVGH